MAHHITLKPYMSDPFWTKEETDYLFSLVRDYDGRFFVVHDRYDFPKGPTRTLEVGLSHHPSLRHIDCLHATGPERAVFWCMSQTGQGPSLDRGRCEQERCD